MLINNQNEKQNDVVIDASYSDEELDAALAALDTESPETALVSVSASIFNYATISEATVRKQAQDAATQHSLKAGQSKSHFSRNRSRSSQHQSKACAWRIQQMDRS